ncbi:YopX family protein [Campylobacter sp. RM16188]|uniref:YopX family protein n=1 Tax=Campylobacter sp. RM16188 TaxID=1705725 RepID=UPI001555A6E6|nr:YopX family protein [Campylobacter sp. RM16188]
MQNLDFRIWDKSEGVMLQVKSIAFAKEFKKDFVRALCLDEYGLDKIIDTRAGSDIDVMEWTKNTDKNNVKIFRNDILKFKTRFGSGTHTGQVVYHKGGCEYLVECEREIFFRFYNIADYEVVGNIYEGIKEIREVCCV